MSSRFRNPETAALLIVLAALGLTSCDQKKQDQANDAPAAQGEPPRVAVTTLFPGGEPAPPEDPHVALYANNPQAVSEGARLFNWYNCSGCHFHGAGGIGPAFIDPQWRYGGRLDQIFTSIYQGRPNGMPYWGNKIPDEQIWEIAAYVKSLSSPSAATGTAPLLPPPGTSGTPPK